MANTRESTHAEILINWTQHSKVGIEDSTSRKETMVTPGGRYSVLIVEDNADIVIGLQDLLQHDGYEVTVAGTCAAAIALVAQQRFNAILLDLGLPDGDGLEVLNDVQRRDPSLPVIIVTAHIAQERTVGSLGKGAFAYLTKPYNREELRQTLRRAIGVKELAVKAERAEQSLTESEHRFQSLVESATDAIVVANGRGIIVSWNRAASRLFGYSVEEILGQPLTLLMPERYRQPHERRPPQDAWLTALPASCPTVRRPISTASGTT